MGIFKAKDLESRLVFFWLAFALITGAFSVISWNVRVSVIIATAMGISAFQGIRKKDKLYLICIAANFVALIHIFFLLTKAAS